MPLRRVLFTLSVALIFSMGMLMVFNTSSADILDKGRAVSTHTAVGRQLSSALAGFLAAALVWSVGVQSWLRISPWLAGISLLLLVMVYVPGIGHIYNGARRWVGVGPIGFQPSDLAKFTLPLFAVHLLTARQLSLRIGIAGIAVIGTSILLVLVEPDKGTAFILGAGVMAALLVTRIRARYWLIPMLVLGLIGAAAGMRSPYVQKRIQVYLHPEDDLLGTGHQPYQARIAAGSGGLFGKGVGQSLQKLSYLPEAQNDYIAAIFAEEFGFIGMTTLILLYLLLSISGLAMAIKAPSTEAMQIAGVLTFLIAIQAFLNLAVVCGALPTTGLNLPFFSQGGTSLVTNMATAALILSVDSWHKDASSSRLEARGAI